MAVHIVAAGYYGADELIGAPNAEGAQLLKMLAGRRAGGARLLRKMLGARALPSDAEIKKVAPFKEIHIFAAIEACRACQYL